MNLLRRSTLLACLAASPALSARPVVAGYERFFAAAGEDTAVEAGLLLLNELNCTACHAPPPAWAARLPGRGKIPLAGIGARLAHHALHDFVADPARFKPGTTMPRLPRSSGASSAAPDVVAYLQSLRTAPIAAAPTRPADPERGRRLYETVGCTACHAPAAGTTGATFASIPITLAPHMDQAALAAFLRDPLATRPAGRMPATPLSAPEAADLAAFIGARPLRPPPATDAALVTRGRTAFAAANCAACHDTGTPVEARAAAPLAQLRADAGCLNATPPADAPEFSLSPAQVRHLAAALAHLRATPAPPAITAAARVDEHFLRLNCFACHEWRGRGGADATRAARFSATDGAAESLGELGRLPPKLDTAGRKLTPTWLERMLWGEGGGVRPYLSARMPRFGRAAAGELPALLAEACAHAHPAQIDTSGALGHQRFAAGRTLLGIGTGGLGCVNCHGVKHREPAGVRAINLTHTVARLRPEYFKALLLDPQGLQPGTVMPPLLAGRANAAKEIEAMWTYLKELDQSPLLPDGLAEPGALELKPADAGRPLVFRTFIEGAGTQAIAVGHPAGAHAVFDAYEVRWALAWRGRFLDAQQTWEERLNKPVKPLGEGAVVLAPHQPFAQLPSATAPWPAAFGPAAGYVFKGYRLGPDGVPVFRYTAGSLQIEDTLVPAPDGRALRRRLTVRGGGDGWYFRGFAPGVAPLHVEWKNGEATFEETLTLP